MRKQEFIHSGNGLCKNKEVYAILANHRILTTAHDGLKTRNKTHYEFEDAKEVIHNFCANSKITSVILSTAEHLLL